MELDDQIQAPLRKNEQFSNRHGTSSRALYIELGEHLTAIKMRTQSIKWGYVFFVL